MKASIGTCLCSLSVRLPSACRLGFCKMEPSQATGSLNWGLSLWGLWCFNPCFWDDAVINCEAGLVVKIGIAMIGQKLKGSFFTGGSFRKGVRVPIGVPEGGVRGRVQGGGGGVVFLWKTREKGKGMKRVGGVGWGPAKEPASQCASFVETTL